MKKNIEHLLDIVCCPRCRAAISIERTGKTRFACSNEGCAYFLKGFPAVSDVPALIDFDTSIFSRESLEESDGRSVVPRSGRAQFIKDLVRSTVMADNGGARMAAAEFVRNCPGSNPYGRVLVIGGAGMGGGMELLYESDKIELVATDVYASPITDVLADAHRLPFKDDCFDGVWIQAVLEHVLDPHLVVGEIHRVLRSDGLVYSETPFMQQVHEGPYDFTRFTASGHRWLFRNFTVMAAGVVGGPGTVAIWSLRYIIRSITRYKMLAAAVSMLFVWLRILDFIPNKRGNADGASATYFLGKKAAEPLQAGAMIDYYGWQIENYGNQVKDHKST